MLVAADNTPDAGFGISNGVREEMWLYALNFFMLGPDPFGLEYQAKDAMHELGHNFGLCTLMQVTLPAQPEQYLKMKEMVLQLYG